MTAKALLAKYGIKPNKSIRAKVALEDRTAEIVKEAVAKKEAKGPSRNDLMFQAKAKGIKNFRILNKKELTQVLDPVATEMVIKMIVDKAVERWRSGFGNRKVTNV